MRPQFVRSVRRYPDRLLWTDNPAPGPSLDGQQSGGTAHQLAVRMSVDRRDARRVLPDQPCNQARPIRKYGLVSGQER